MTALSFIDHFGLKRNPFSPSPLGTDRSLSDLFVDREVELKNAVAAVQLGKNLLIAGERGIGKTTLINAARRTISRKEKDVLIIDVPLLDLATSATSDPTPLLRALTLELQKHVSGDRPLTLQRLREHNEFVRAISDTLVPDLLLVIESFVKQLQKNHKRIVLVFDNVDKTSLDLTMLSGARDVLWKMNAVYVFSANMKQHDRLVDSAMEPFFQRIILRRFNQAETRELLNRRLAPMSDKDLRDIIDADLVANIQRLSGGNPRLALLMCEEGFKRASSRRADRVTALDISSYLNDRLESELYRELVNILSTRPERLSVKEIHELLGKKDVVVSRSRVSQLLAELTRRGLVYMEKSGRYHKYGTVISPKVLSE